MSTTFNLNTHLKVIGQVCYCNISCLRTKGSFCINVMLWSRLLLIVVVKGDSMDYLRINALSAIRVSNQDCLLKHRNYLILSWSEIRDNLIVLFLSSFSFSKFFIQIFLDSPIVCFCIFYRILNVFAIYISRIKLKLFSINSNTMLNNSYNLIRIE